MVDGSRGDAKATGGRGGDAKATRGECGDAKAKGRVSFNKKKITTKKLTPRFLPPPPQKKNTHEQANAVVESRPEAEKRSTLDQNVRF